MEWDSTHNWRRIIERRLNEIGSMVKGNQDFQSDRILDVIEQVEELRQELQKVAERQEKIATYIKTHLPNDKKG